MALNWSRQVFVLLRSVEAKVLLLMNWGAAVAAEGEAVTQTVAVVPMIVVLVVNGSCARLRPRTIARGSTGRIIAVLQIVLMSVVLWLWVV